MAKKNDNDIISVIDDDFEERPRKKGKAPADDGPDYTDYKNERGTGVRHYSAKDNANGGDAVRFFGDGETEERRPSLDGYSAHRYEENSLSGLYSDSGKTVCMVMRVISCVLFLIAPVSFVGDMLAIFGADGDVASAGAMISSVIDSLIGAIMYVIAGFLVIALIKILQNLMALQKKR